MKKLLLALIFLYTTLLSGQIDTNTIEEVVVSAFKTSEKTNRVVQQSTSITSKQIQMLQSQTTADLLQTTGNIFIQKSQQGGGSTTIRGFEANKVLLVVDGIRMNNAIYRGGHLQNVITLDNLSLDKVEVLYGPASTTYGSDALGGVIHFYTKKPMFSLDDKTLLKGNVSFRSGTANKEMTPHVDFNIGGKNFASWTSVTASRFNDLVMGKNINNSLGRAFGERVNYVERINGKDSLVTNANKYEQVSTAYDQIDIVQKFSHKLSESLSHGVNIQLSTSTDVPRYDRLTDPSAATGLNQAQWYYGPQKRFLAAYQIEKNIGNGNAMNLGVDYQSIEESRHNRRFGSSKLNSRIENLSIIGFHGDFKKIIGNHTLRYGVDGQINDLKSTAMATNIKDNTVSALDTRYPDGKNSFSQFGLYASHIGNVTDKIVLNDGLRIGTSSLNSNFVNKQFFPFPFDNIKQSNLTYSGQVGLAYLVNDKSKIGGGISTGFRVPNIDDLAKVFESTATTLIVPNPSLKPEKTVNAELNTLLYLAKDVVIDAAVYQTWLSDAIVVDAFTFNGASIVDYGGGKSNVVASQNKGKAKVSGLSAALKVGITSSLKGDVSVNYTKGTIIADAGNTPLDHIPPFMMRAGFLYNKNKFGANAYLLYNGWKKIADYKLGGEDNEQYAPTEGMPSWATINFRLNYAATKNVNIIAGIDNLMDLQYRTFSSGINGAGRNLSGTVKVSF